ncbi:uncharacterized protein LOC129711037 [Leucoraja erinacea]|uniref:uncharacterized protein LOC129711037 n=1 Tax=Leucoraja erinaceus TaxID=7782 RepID=UPI0024545F4D|nr:uncharacterized protein LOC129711037 [Leucoraja erinacea]
MEPARPIPLPVNRGPRPLDFRCPPTTPPLGAPVDCCAVQDAFIAGELLKLMNLSAAKIQALWRGYCARKQQYIEQGAAILLQSFWRGCRVRHVLREPVSRRLRIHGQYLSWEDPRVLCPPPPPAPRRGPPPPPPPPPRPRSREGRRWPVPVPVPEKRPAASTAQSLPIKKHPDGIRCQPSRRLRDICAQPPTQPQPQPPRARTPRFVCDQTQQNRLPGMMCDVAATRIQTNWRGYKVRKDMSTLLGAVVYIQSFFRGYLDRKKINPPRPHQPEPLDQESDMVDFNLSYEHGQLRSHGAASGMPLDGLDVSLPSSLYAPTRSSNNTGGARPGTGPNNNRAGGARSGTGPTNTGVGRPGTGPTNTGVGRSGNDNSNIIRSGDCISYCICAGIGSVRPGNGGHAGSVHSVSTGSNDSIRSVHCNSNDGTRTGSVRSGASSSHSVRSVNYNNDCAGSGTGGHTGHAGSVRSGTGSSSHSVRSANYNNDCAGHTGSVRCANNINHNHDRVRAVNYNNDCTGSGSTGGGGHAGSARSANGSVRSGHSGNHDSIRAVHGSFLSTNASISSGGGTDLPVNGGNPPRSFNGGSAGPDNCGPTRPVNGDKAGDVNELSSIPHPEGARSGAGPAEVGTWLTRGWGPGSGEQSVLREPLSIIDEDPKSDELLPGYMMNGGGGGGDTGGGGGVDTVSCCSSAPVSLASARLLKKRSVEEVVVVRAERGEDGRPRFAFRAPGADTDTLLPPGPGSQYLVHSTPYNTSGPRKLIRYQEHRPGGGHPHPHPYPYPELSDFDLSELEVPKDAAGCPPPPGQPARRSLKRLREESAAAGTIQAAWKGHRTRRALQEQVSAATKIQATFRRYQTRREFESEGIFPLVSLKAAGKKAAKTTVPSPPLPPTHRAPRQPEPRVHNEQTPPPLPPAPPAAVEMEARERDAPVFAPLCTPGIPVPSAAASGLHNRIEQWARRSVRTRRQHQERDRAATAIQAVWRGLLARRRITRMARAAVMIQACFRGYQIRKFLGSIGRNPQGGRERGGGKPHPKAARPHRAAAGGGGQRPQETGWRAQLKGDKPAIYVKRNPCYNPRKVTIHVKATAAEQS